MAASSRVPRAIPLFDIKRAHIIVNYVKSYDETGLPNTKAGWDNFANDLLERGVDSTRVAYLVRGLRKSGLEYPIYKKYLQIDQSYNEADDRPGYADYRGLTYYKYGGNRESEQDDALSIAKALVNYGRPIPRRGDRDGWDLFGVYLYSAGIPAQVNKSIVSNGYELEYPHILMYYLDRAGYEPQMEALGADLREDAVLTAKMVNEIYEEYEMKHGSIFENRSPYNIGKLSRLFRKYGVPRAVVAQIQDDLKSGSGGVALREQLELARQH